MINLSTGLPGAGKTLFTIAFVKELAEKEHRPVFYSGINDLALDWHEHDAEKWMDCPEGAIIVIDECQRLFRPRGSGAKVPEFVSGLETHRHKGVDIFLITQHPMLMDANVRRLTERHWHICRKFGMQRATVLQFESCKEQPLSHTAIAKRFEWKYPKEVFGYYKSAEVHTVKRRLPMMYYIMFIAPLTVGALIWYFVDQHYQDGQIMATKSQRDRLAAGGQAITGDPLVTSGYVPGKSAAAAEKKPLTPKEYAESFEPRIPGLAYTAPVYDEVTKVVEAPVPVACLSNESQGCKCYSQQGTSLAMHETLCKRIVDKGFFLAFELKSAQESKRESEARQRSLASPRPDETLPASDRVRWIVEAEPSKNIGDYLVGAPKPVSGSSTNPKYNPSVRGG